MIQFPIFWRQHGVRKLGDLTILQDLVDIEELPVFSILHLLDNFDVTEDLFIVPNTLGDLFTMQPERKILAHNLSIQSRASDVYTEVDKDIRIPLGSILVPLQKFRNANSRTIRFAAQLEQLQPRAGYQAVINHNNLFRSRVLGINRKARLFEHVMRAVINAAAIQPDRKHLIPIHISDALFNKSSFERAFKEISRKTLRYPNSMHYVFMAHFLAYVHSKSTASMFSKIPQALMENLVFVIIHGQKAVFYDPTYLKTENGDNNAILMRLIAQFNMLASSGSIVSEDVAESIPESAKEDVPEAAPAVGEPDKSVQPEESEDETDTQTAEPVYQGPTVPTEVVEHRVTPTTDKNVALYESKPLAPKEEKKLLEQDRTKLDEVGAAQAANIFDATRAKVVRVQRLAVAYKSLQLEPDGPTLETLITTPHPDKIDDHPIEVLKDQVPDASMLSSRVNRFNQDYLKYQFHADMARVLVSFNQHGLYLVDVHYEDKIDELNRIRQYTAKYEDLNHQTHTIRFSFPLIDPYGNCWINGVQKFLKKQRVNNPIVKSGPARVSLSTNYNKVLVERVASVANSFYPYMTELFRKTEAVLTYGVAQDDSNWLYLILDNNAKTKAAYDNRKPIDVALEGEAVDVWSNNSDIYAKSPYGPVRIIKKTSTKTAVKLTVVGTTILRSLPYEYTTLGAKLKNVQVKKASFCFHYNHRLQALAPELHDTVLDSETHYGVYIGTSDGTNQCFMNVRGELTVMEPENPNPIRVTTLIDEYARITEITPNQLNDYVILKILNAVLPLGVVMCYRFGLRHILNYLKVSYQLIKEEDLRKRIHIPASSVVVRFKNAKLIIPRTPTVQALILAGLNAYKLKEFTIEEMEEKDVYYSMLEQKGMSTNYLKGVDSFFDFFLDPITIDVLRRMGEPTDLLDLLIRAVSLLATEDFEPASSTKNSRIRSYERFAGVLYNELAQAVATHKYRAIGAKTSISINPMSIYKRIQSDSLMENMNTINPLHDIKMNTVVSHVGDGGRSEQTFMIGDRQFTPDSIGVISEATVDSGNVAVIVSTSMNPKLDNLRGQSAGVDPATVEPAQLLSMTSLLFPGATQDDEIHSF